MKNEGHLENLLAAIIGDRFVNLFEHEKKIQVKKLLNVIAKETERVFCVPVDKSKFRKCRDEEDEARVFLKLMRKGGCEPQLLEGLDECFSIANVMDRINERMDEPGLIVFHYFGDKYDEKEKDILRSIRKYISLNDGSFLEILIISNEPVDRWELFPESNLDGRFVTFVKHEVD
jgi:hypothetical protein